MIPLTYSVLSELIRDYPDDAPVYAEFPLHDDLPMVVTPTSKGYQFRHFQSMPPAGCPLIPTDIGLHEIAGVLYRTDGPVLLLFPARG
jgi:hypothetical protein